MSSIGDFKKANIIKKDIDDDILSDSNDEKSEEEIDEKEKNLAENLPSPLKNGVSSWLYIDYIDGAEYVGEVVN
jgi:hypothetical protein